jgi:hypothetical protein
MSRLRREGRDVVATILAVGIALAVNLLMFAILWDALRSDTPGLSENATQVIIASLTGIVGVLGGYVGGKAAEAQRRERTEHAEVEAPPTPGPTAPPTTPSRYPSDEL